MCAYGGLWRNYDSRVYYGEKKVLGSITVRKRFKDLWDVYGLIR